MVTRCTDDEASSPLRASKARAPLVRRVAIVLSELRGGGMERVVLHLAGALTRMGVEARIFCVRKKGALAAEAEAQGLRVAALDSTRGYDLLAVGRLAALLRRHRPDAINVHDRASLPYVFLANRLAGRRPIVLSCHGLLLAAPQARRVERAAMRDVKVVTAVSRQTADEYARALGWPRDVRVIPNGVPMPPERGEARAVFRGGLGVPEDQFVWLAVGNLKPEKGFEDLIEAAGMLRARPGMPPFCVLVAGGESDASYAQRLRGLLRDRGLDGTVRFLGYRRDAQALYAAADGFVLSSRKEGLPMVLLEAMAAGLPVVATRVGGVPQVVADGPAGLLAEAASPADLADAMARVMADGPLRQRLGASARLRIERAYSVQQMAGRYLESYGRALADAGERRRSGKPPRDARPRVLMLGPLPPLTGGMATVTDNLRRSALSRRCQLSVLQNGKVTPQGRPLWKGALAQGRLLGRVLREVWRTRPDVVHVHTCSQFSFWRDCVHMAACRLAGCGFVWHAHDGSFQGFVGRQRPLLRRLLGAALRQAHVVIVLSDETRRALEPLVPGVGWLVIPNGVPVPRLTPKPSGPDTRFIFLGNLSQRKGAFDLVEAVVRIADRVPVCLDLAGDEKEPGQRAALERHIARCGCGDRVRLLGVITARAKEQAMAEAHAMVLPSYAEGLPMALLEAMAYGMPTIATRVGAVPEAVTDGVEGFLIEPGDVEALADRMLRLAANPDLRRRMGEAARRRAEAEFGIDLMVERIMAVYREVLGRGRVGR